MATTRAWPLPSWVRGVSWGSRSAAGRPRGGADSELADPVWVSCAPGRTCALDVETSVRLLARQALHPGGFMGTRLIVTTTAVVLLASRAVPAVARSASGGGPKGKSAPTLVASFHDPGALN